MLAVLAAVVLAAGTTIEADLKGGEVHGYDVDLAAGTFIAVRIDQRGVDLRPAIVAPDGATLVEIDTREWGEETAAIVARTAGRYRVEARAVEAKAPPGHYVLHVDALRPATAEDEAWASALGVQSRAYATLRKGGRDNMAQARDLYSEALAQWRVAGNRAGEADAYMALGFASNWLDDFRAAADFHAKDVGLRRELGDEYAEARARVNYGRNIRTLGDAAAAANEFAVALERHKAAGRLNSAVDALVELAISARWAGDYGRALEYGYEAVALSRQIGSASREAYALATIGPIHLELGELEHAITAFGRARQLAPADETLNAQAQSALGLAYAQLGRFEEAEQSLTGSLTVWTARGWRGYESDTLRNFGALFMLRGDYERARDAFERAAAKARENRFLLGEALSTRQAGEALMQLGRLDEADRAFTAAAELFTADDPIAQAVVWTDQAKVARARGNLAVARDRAEAAIRVVESLRGRARSARLRSAMLASAQTIYRTLIDVLMAEHLMDPAKGMDRLAFDVAERARARSLLELVLDDRVGASSDADSEPLNVMRDLHRRLNAKARALDDARRAGNPSLGATLVRDLDELTDAYGLAEARARRDRPATAVANDEPLRIADIQRDLLDPATALMEFALGDSASYAWIVTQSAVRSVWLAPRTDIEAAVAAAQHALQERASARDALTRVGRLLIDPLGPLPAVSRVLIVAPGALQQTPFAALPSGPRHDPLVARYDVVHAPSASVMAAIRAGAVDRPGVRHTAAVFADPVFDADDPRVHAGAATPTEPPMDPVPGLPASGARAGLARLPFTRIEADAIASLVPKSSLLLATGFDASVSTISNPSLANYRIIHFATHGIIDTRTPELSGLALSMVDKEGRRQDGFLRLYDVSRLRLNADLVVLSGCETALGRAVDGEGVIGLTRAFVVAGSSRVVASLWKVDDRATAELMKAFYVELLARHRPAVAALAAAQRRMASSSRWQHPYFWAGFVIQGEWR